MLSQYLYHNESAKTTLSQLQESHKAAGKPSAVIVRNGIILPRIPDPISDTWGLGGVFDENFQFVENSREKGFGGFYDFDHATLSKNDCDVLYLGYFIQHWGVFLVDFLRRLYWKYLPENHFSNLKIAYCGIGVSPDSLGKIGSKCRELFALMGIPETDLIDIRQPTQFRNVIVPEVGYAFDESYYSEFVLPYQEASLNAMAEASGNLPKKIYLSRTKFNSRITRKKETGEKAIERFFAKNGFTVVFPEELTVTEQIRLFSAADTIASMEGSVAHNILFSRPGTRQIIIRKQKEVNPRQYLFNEATKTDVQYIDCYRQIVRFFPIDHDMGPFFLVFNKNLRQFARDNGMAYSRTFFLSNILSFFVYPIICARSLFTVLYSRRMKK